MEDNPDSPKTPIPHYPEIPVTDMPPAIGSVKPKRSLKKILLIVLLIILATVGAGVALVAFLVITVFRGVSSDISECTQGRKELFANEQSITKEFDSIVLIADQPQVKADVSRQEGDCVDSLPSLRLEKLYFVQTTAGKASDTIEKSMREAGYTPSMDSSYAPGNPCEYNGRQYQYIIEADPPRVIEILMTCSASSIGEQEWREIPITKVQARLIAEWERKS